MKISEMTISQRPREKAILYGIDSLSDHELLMLVLRHGNSKTNVSQIALDVLKYSEGLSKLHRMDMSDFMQINGIKQAKALELMAILELNKRVLRAKTLHMDVISHPQTLVQWLQLEIGSEMQECFLVVFLNVQNQVTQHKIIFKGTLDRSLIHPREIFNMAVKVGASSFIAVHNHPAGSLVPSTMDLEVTEILVQAGEMMQIKMLDHIIVTREGYCSIFSYLYKQTE